MPDTYTAPDPLRGALGFVPGLVPPGLFLQGDEAIRVTSLNSAAGVELAVEGLQHVPGHGARVFGDRHVPNTDRTAAQTLIRLAEGWLTEVQIRVQAGTVVRGQCFVLVELVRGSSTTNATPLGTLVQGYVTSAQRRSYPGSPIELSTEGPGVVRVVTGTDPAAGVECSDTVPAGARWRLLAWLSALVTSATVANRIPAIVIDDGAANLFATMSGVNVTASLTTTLSASDDGFGNSTAGVVVKLSLPSSLILRPGFRIRTSTILIQAGDNYAAPNLLVEEWIDG